MARAIINNVQPGSDAEQLIRTWVEEALERLQPGGTIIVEVAGLYDPLAPGGGEAAGGPDGLWLHTSIIVAALTHGGWREQRFGFIVYEEVAHAWRRADPLGTDDVQAVRRRC